MAKRYRAFEGDDYIGRGLLIGDHQYSILTRDYEAAGGATAIAERGRKATVYKVKQGSSYFALKVFAKKFALRENVISTTQLRQYANVPGLKVCKREIVGDTDAYEINEPGLAFAILMPWISGKSWHEILANKEGLSQRQCIALARKTAEVLKGLEDRKLVHADISSGNVFIELGSSPRIELIDVEDMYHPNFFRLPFPPDGSPGYNHPGNKGKGCQNPYGDRFAGAVLLAEMLTWHQPKIRSESEEGSYFHYQKEMCKSNCAKYDTMIEALQAHSMEMANLFKQAWHSKDLADCPTLGEWYSALMSVKETSKTIETDNLAGLVPSRSYFQLLLENPLAFQTQLVTSFVCTECGERVRVDTPTDHAPTCSEHPNYFKPAFDMNWLFQNPSLSSTSRDYFRSVFGRYSLKGTYTCDECGYLILRGNDRSHKTTCSRHPDYEPPPLWSHTLQRSTPSLSPDLLSHTCDECGNRIMVGNDRDHKTTCSKHPDYEPPPLWLNTLQRSTPSLSPDLLSYTCDECGNRIMVGSDRGHKTTCSKHPDYEPPPLWLNTLQRSTPSLSPDLLSYTCDECSNRIMVGNNRSHKTTCSKHPDYKKPKPSKFSDVSFIPLDIDTDGDDSEANPLSSLGGIGNMYFCPECKKLVRRGIKEVGHEFWCSKARTG